MTGVPGIPRIRSGQLWQLGNHRVIIGDCTDPEIVSRLMGDDKAILCHADPPYGMGKKTIKNDNLRGDKLDVFQMAWWSVARNHLEDNASAYIWGKAENLWRLWYLGGLRDSERLTFRSEIVWQQEGASWGKSGMKGLRQFAQNGERALFFMLGEQGFNNNADNYWEGFRPIQEYLKAQKEIMGWSTSQMAGICGLTKTSSSARHWVFESQWTFITRGNYEKLQSAANGKAFKREYNELEREYNELKIEHNKQIQAFYATRAPFDNTHDNMTDVWDFPRVKGKERYNHDTPKPVAMMERVIKSSCPEGLITLVPFLGTAPELIAAESHGRRVYGCEISPDYVAVILQRWADMTGLQPELINPNSQPNKRVQNTQPPPFVPQPIQGEMNLVQQLDSDV